MIKSILLWIVNIIILSFVACTLGFVAIHVIWKFLILIFVYFLLMVVEGYLFDDWFSWSEAFICTIDFVVTGGIFGGALWIYGDYISPKLVSLSGNPYMGGNIIWYGMLFTAFIGVVMIACSSFFRLKNWRKKRILDNVIKRVETKVDREVDALVQEKLADVKGNWLKKQMIAQKLAKSFKSERMKPYWERRKIYGNIAGKWQSIGFWGLFLLMLVLAPVILIAVWLWFNYLSFQ